MDEIVARSTVTDIMAEIGAAGAGADAGIEQINRAIAQMDQVTQQNAALVEEAAAAAESMQEQAQSLAKAVAIFKVTAGENAPSPGVSGEGSRAVRGRGLPTLKRIAKPPDVEGCRPFALLPPDNTVEAARKRLEGLRKTARIGDVIAPTGERWRAERAGS